MIQLAPHPPAARTTSRATVALAWLVVLVPAGWGVSQTVLQATALFRAPPPTDAPAAPAAPGH
ncbi:MAG TPA: hypothetical protein VF796_04490 [Humisphaera sp.]